MKRNYDYILRYCVEPGHCQKERLDQLVEFCKKSHTAEVMFFVLPEELNTGHATMEELGPWMDTLREGKRRLEEIGVRFSINPWMTTLHCDRGRKLKPGQNFRPMVDIDGQAADACACPSDEAWLENLCACYAEYAKLNPKVLWIEDDFRLHNHGELNWGGCFCDEHMKLYSRKAGKNLTRQEFVSAVCAPGKPHPYRKIWLDTARETMINLAGRIAEAVFQVNPDIQLGLMTSNPSVHCAEARDWDAIMDRLTGNRRPCVRIHMPSYNEVTSNGYSMNFQMVSRMTKAMLPKDIEIYPELENFHSSRFAKSNRFTRFQMESSIQLGAAGITMNIYDMMGNGVLLNEKCQDMLAQDLPFMNMTRTMGIHEAEDAGVEILVNKDASYTVSSSDAASLSGLYPHENDFAGLLGAFSIATRYQTGKPAEGSIAAISGGYLEGLTDEQIRELLNNHCLMMTGDCLDTLKDRGLLNLIGAAALREIPECNGEASYEEVVNGKKFCGIEKARQSMQCGAGTFIAVEYENEDQMEVLTRACSPEGRKVAPAMVLIRRSILILPYKDFYGNWGPHRFPVRCELIKYALEQMKAAAPTYAVDTPYLTVYQYQSGSQKILSLANTSTDDYENFDLVLDQPLEQGQAVTLYNHSALMGRPAHYQTVGRVLHLEESVDHFETIFLTIE